MPGSIAKLLGPHHCRYSLSLCVLPGRQTWSHAV
jgi:hypothetical protein